MPLEDNRQRASPLLLTLTSSSIKGCSNSSSSGTKSSRIHVSLTARELQLLINLFAPTLLPMEENNDSVLKRC